MTEQKPKWLEGWTPTPPVEAKPIRPVGNPAWTPNCPSPNKSGRPKGIPDKRLLATQQMLDEMRNIVSVFLTKRHVSSGSSLSQIQTVSYGAWNMR